MANRIPTLLATAVAAACSLSAHANGPTQADFAKVVLYSNVTIAQDSSSQWGIWEELEPTAAGPQTPLPLLAGTTELYRPVGAVTPSTPVQPPVQPPVVSACTSGGLCGFGVMALSTYSWDQKQLEVAAISEGESNDLRVGFQLFPQTTTAPTWLPESMSISTQPIRSDEPATVPSFNVQGPLVLDGLNSHDYETPFADLPVGAEGNYERVSIETDLESSPSGVPVGKFQGGLTIVRYVSGGTDSPPLSGTEQFGEMYGVWGITTPAQDMDNLRLSNAQANYYGNTFNGAGNATGSVQMSVNFGTSTFKADFNGGSGVSNPLMGGQLQQTANGGYQVNGALSFSAAGTISGSQFSSKSLDIGGPYKAITGKVEGAFFGQNAAVAGGVADVSAVVTAPGFTSPVYARYATPFVAVKGEPRIEK
ncbi:HupA family protein [Aquabacterium parvum]|jgi:hypothetical protein|uniref:hypothetical protein n=1 Tax=Aquabacterium parvum TaxID=70584 RepID=UPI000718ED39|nr:hypothetical protein [Aquabacterium parvum]MBU0917526.1 transferrin-binding protein-like solute binding protein [Gammaproteobacteria bacterium]